MSKTMNKDSEALRKLLEAIVNSGSLYHLRQAVAKLLKEMEKGKHK